MSPGEISPDYISRRLDDLQREATHNRQVADVILKQMKALSTEFEAQRARLDLVGSRLDLIDGRLDRLEQETPRRHRAEARPTAGKALTLPPAVAVTRSRSLLRIECPYRGTSIPAFDQEQSIKTSRLIAAAAAVRHRFRARLAPDQARIRRLGVEAGA